MPRRRSAGQPSLPNLVEQYTNRGLFADHYLRERLPGTPEWQCPPGPPTLGGARSDAAGPPTSGGAPDEGLDAVFEAALRLYRERAAGFGAGTNEAQTERDFIQPLLDLMWGGRCYQIQVALPGADERGRPDYALFRNEEERQGAEPLQGRLEYWRDAAAVGDAKAWRSPLDRQRGDENPSAQVGRYLWRSAVRWGILTNGSHWRLYERESSRAGGTYFEVNLEEILQHGDREGFRWFYLFFRRAAFVPDAGGECFVERVLRGSLDYAESVGERLKESVYDALRHLVNGFLEWGPNGLDASDPEALREVHESSLIVLYRLLFLLYAEDRGLLPRGEGAYAPHSLYTRLRDINRQLREGRPYPRGTRGIWNGLTYLFELIDGGLPEAGIPAYNGGLFSAQRYPHIAHQPLAGHRAGRSAISGWRTWWTCSASSGSSGTRRASGTSTIRPWRWSTSGASTRGSWSCSPRERRRRWWRCL